MYWVNKIVWFFVNPVIVPLLLGLAALVWRKRWIGWVALGAIWFESTMSCVCLLGLPLERPYLATQAAEALPSADAIVVLGGGIGKVDGMVYPDMFPSADRVWHAARLWKAGKAPKVVVSGCNDLAAAVPLLTDLGVPREAIVMDDESRNTYENSRFTEKLLVGEGGEGAAAPSVLLVTSAWHMPRACGNFAKTSLRVIPAAADFVTYNAYYASRHWWDWVMPSPGNLDTTSFLFKEWLGRLARR